MTGIDTATATNMNFWVISKFRMGVRPSADVSPRRGAIVSSFAEAVYSGGDPSQPTLDERQGLGRIGQCSRAGPHAPGERHGADLVAPAPARGARAEDLGRAQHVGGSAGAGADGCSALGVALRARRLAGVELGGGEIDEGADQAGTVAAALALEERQRLLVERHGLA